MNVNVIVIDGKYVDYEKNEKNVMMVHMVFLFVVDVDVFDIALNVFGDNLIVKMGIND